MTASITTRVGLAREAAAHWRRVYFDKNRGAWRLGDDKRVIHEKLLALGSDPTPDDVDRVIGNGSWTECECDECEKKCDAIANVGDGSGGEYRSGRVCLDCLREAVAALEAYHSKECWPTGGGR